MDSFKTSQASSIFKAMSNEKRLRIIYYILDKELSVGEIEKLIGLSQSALSQHLAVLRAEHIVKTRRKAQTIYYTLKDDRVRAIINLINKLF